MKEHEAGRPIQHEYDDHERCSQQEKEPSPVLLLMKKFGQKSDDFVGRLVKFGLRESGILGVCFTLNNLKRNILN